jgi:hypothetical protein
MIELASVGMQAGDSLDCGGEGIGEQLVWLIGELLKQLGTELGDIPGGAMATANLQALGDRGPIEQDHDPIGCRYGVLVAGAAWSRLGREGNVHGVRRPRVGREE